MNGSLPFKNPSNIHTAQYNGRPSDGGAPDNDPSPHSNSPFYTYINFASYPERPFNFARDHNIQSMGLFPTIQEVKKMREKYIDLITASKFDEANNLAQTYSKVGIPNSEFLGGLVERGIELLNELCTNNQAVQQISSDRLLMNKNQRESDKPPSKNKIRVMHSWYMHLLKIGAVDAATAYAKEITEYGIPRHELFNQLEMINTSEKDPEIPTDEPLSLDICFPTSDSNEYPSDSDLEWHIKSSGSEYDSSDDES